MTPEERFWSHVDKSGDCWIWTGCHIKDGYGLCRFNGAVLLTHRVSYVLANGPIPDRAKILHRCDNPPCVNPVHLFAGTDSDNMADMVAKGRSMFGERNPNAKLTAGQALAIFNDCRSTRVIARSYGVTHSKVSYIKNKIAWRSIHEGGAMKKFKVLITRDATESAEVVVYADDVEGAADKALELAKEESLTVDWNLNDNTGEEAYLGGGCPHADGGDVTEIDEDGNDVPKEVLG